MFARKLVLFLFLFFFSLSAFAQDSEDAVKQKLARETKLLEQILSDAKNLQLPENRAIVFARIGNCYWQTDEKKARKLFQDSISELIAAQSEVRNEKTNKQYFQPLLYGQTPRFDIINQIGNRDAELALEYFAKSRPPVIAEAIQNLNEDGSSSIQQYARSEIATEQRLLALAADQNPQLAIKRVRESLKKGVSYETLNLLKKIYTKDPQTADKLVEEVCESLLDVDLSKNYQTADAVGYFVADMGRPRTPDEKSLKIPDDLLRRLVSKMIDSWLNPKNNQYYGYANSMPVIEKLFPDRAAQVKKKVESSNNQNDEGQEYNKLMASEATPEQMVAQAEKFQSSYRNEIYRSAAQKFAQNGNIVQAERILQTNISDEQSEYYLTQFYVNLSYQLASEGKFEEANNYINQISDDSQRVSALINLANTVYQKDQKENQKLAQSILNQARSLIPEAPETQNDLNSAVYLATAYAPFDSNESFRLIEPLLPTLNELIQANFILIKFRNYGGSRQGEMQIGNGNNLGIYNLEGTLRVLKDKDFDRTLQFANGFNRPETRIWLQMQLIDDSLLSINSLPINSRSFVMMEG